MLRRLLAILAVTLASTTPAHADELQNRIVAQARANRADALAYRRTVVIERTGTARKTFIADFDPRRTGPARWTLVSVDGRAPTAKEAAELRKTDSSPGHGYAELARWFGGPAVRSDPAPGIVVYRFARLPAGIVKLGPHDASADMQAEAVVNTRGPVPFIERVRLTLTKGFRMMLVASVQQLTATARYRALADGTIVPVDLGSETAGSLMGKAGTLKTSASFALQGGR